MNKIIWNPCVVLVAVLFLSGCSSEKDGLKTLLPQWKEAWNSNDISKAIALFHPDSMIYKECNSNVENKKELENEFYELLDEFGTIETWKIRKYIKREKQYVVKITYSKRGVATGTMSAKKNSDGIWKIWDFEIGG